MSKITAKPLDLSVILASTKSIKNRIDKIGIELEGGWNTLPRGVALVHDGSVRFSSGRTNEMPPAVAALYHAINAGSLAGFPDTAGRDASYNQLYSAWQDLQPNHVGEYPSVALELGQWIAWIKTAYPSHTNASCGMHVHMSFRTGKRKNDALTYQRLMDPAYTATLLDQFTKWAVGHREVFPPEHHIWDRLMGNGQYCQALFHADSQAKQTRKDYRHDGEGHRYTAVNYCWSLHGTLEFRTLPMMPTVDLAIEAITHLLNVTNAFLVVSRSRDLKKKIEIPCDDYYFQDTINLSI